MITPEPSNREILAQLEASAAHEDQLIQRAITQLREMMDDREAIEDLQRRATQVQIARSGLIVEMAMAMKECDGGCEILRLAPRLRPKPRLVQ